MPMTSLQHNPTPQSHPFAGRAWRDLVRFVGEALAAGLFASLVLALATFVVATQAGAAPGPRDDDAPPARLLATTTLGALRRRRLHTQRERTR
jgi:hypothetical protein